jgi:hypothetical protein
VSCDELGLRPVQAAPALDTPDTDQPIAPAVHPGSPASSRSAASVSDGPTDRQPGTDPTGTGYGGQRTLASGTVPSTNSASTTDVTHGVRG